MKIKFINLACASLALLVISNKVLAGSLTFSSAVTSDLVSEGAASYAGSVNYTTGLWGLGDVTSARLTLFLSDDVSSNFAPNIDAPREWAQLTSVSDGAASLGALPGAVEVDPQLFVESDPDVIAAATLLGASPADLVATATSAGIEKPSVLPSLAGYFDLDVASLLNSSNSGSLAFELMAQSLYPDIDATNPDALAFINALNGSSNNSFMVNEDFIFDHAELRVEFVPAPPAIWLIGSGLLGLLYTRRKIA